MNGKSEKPDKTDTMFIQRRGLKKTITIIGFVFSLGDAVPICPQDKWIPNLVSHPLHRLPFSGSSHLLLLGDQLNKTCIPLVRCPSLTVPVCLPRPFIPALA